MSEAIRTEENTADGMGGVEIDILARAALFRGEFSIDWVQEITGSKASEILLSLHEGLRRSWLEQVSPDVYAFADEKTRKELIDSIPERERTELHHQIAKLISEQGESGSKELQDLAHHLLGSHRDLDVCEDLVAVGGTLYRNSRNGDARRCFAAAIAYLRTNRGVVPDSLLVDAVYRYCRIFTGEDDPTWIIAVIEDAIERAEENSLASMAILLKMHLAKYEWYRGREREAIECFNAAWESALADGDPDLLRRARYLRMFFFTWQQRFKGVVDTYEEQVPEIEEYPRFENPIAVTGMVGVSYVYCGQISRGLGLLKALYDNCSRLDDPNLLGFPALNLGEALLEMGRVEEAIGTIEDFLGRRDVQKGAFLEKTLHVVLAQAYGEKADRARALEHFRLAARIATGPAPFVPMVGCGRLASIAPYVSEEEMLEATGISFEESIRVVVGSEHHVYPRGMAHYLRAIFMQKDDRPPEEILEELLISAEWIAESGHVIQLAKVRLMLARTYLTIGDESRAVEAARSAHGVLSSIDASLMPRDLMSIVVAPQEEEDLRDILLDTGREIVGIRGRRELVHHVLSTINRVTGSERGAIFLVTGNGSKPRLELIAARSLTPEDVAHESFQAPLAFIRETASGKKPRTMSELPTGDPNLSPDGNATMPRSAFCVPMVLRDKTIGVLYHDNTLTKSRLSGPDLKVLSDFAGWASIALDNVRAYEEIQHLNRQLREEKAYYLEQHLKSAQFEEFVGESAAIRETQSQIQQVAPTDTTVLIQGETGAGKELVARVIHRASDRNSRPFIRVDCSALSENLITSELFGHERGAFTGATERHIGRFELADGGTLFLDEIGNIPMETQNRLLRVLETREFQRVGSVKTIRSDFRLLTATNESLQSAVKSGRFREDLFYRLNVFPITVPPLRDRREDVPQLALFFLQAHATRMGRAVAQIAKADMDRLTAYHWPGNVRELENVIERGVIISDGTRFVMPELSPVSDDGAETRVGLSLAENEKQHILWALGETRGKIQGKDGAAALLDIHHNTLRSRMKKLGISSSRRTE